MTSLSDGLGPQKDPNSGRTRVARNTVRRYLRLRTVEAGIQIRPQSRGISLLTNGEPAATAGQRRRDGQEELVGLLERGAVAVGDPPDVVVIAATVANARRVQKGRAPHYHQLPQRRRRLGALILDQISRGLGGAVKAQRSANQA